MNERKLVSLDETHAGEGIFIVRLSRPNKLNAVDLATLDELDTVFTRNLISRLNEVKVVVLTGEGKAFTSGLDLTSPSVSQIFSSTTESPPGVRALELQSLIQHMQRPILSIANFPRPVICAINGICVGLGVDIACACDIRLCSRNAKLSVREIKIGICADLGSLFFLPRICRNDSWVREVCFSGRFFDGNEALLQGLVSSIAEDAQGVLDMALSIARDIATNPPVAVEGIKVHLSKSVRTDMKENFEFVAIWNSIKLQDSEMILRCVSDLMRRTGAKL